MGSTMGPPIGEACSRMRVIHVVPAVAEEASGPTYSVLRLCDSLIETGEDLTLAALDWSGEAPQFPYLKVFPLGLGPRRLGRSPSMDGWLRTRVLRCEVDLI